MVPLPEATAAAGLAPSTERLVPAAHALNWSAAPSGSAAGKGKQSSVGTTAEGARMAGGSCAGAARRRADRRLDSVGAVTEVTAAAGGFRAGASRRGAEAGAPGARSTLCKAAALARYRALCETCYPGFGACDGRIGPAVDAAASDEGCGLGIGRCRAKRRSWQGGCSEVQASAAQLPSLNEASHATAASAAEDAPGMPVVGTETDAPCESGCAPLALDVRGTYREAKRSTRHARLWAALLEPPTPFAGWTCKPHALEEFD